MNLSVKVLGTGAAQLKRYTVNGPKRTDFQHLFCLTNFLHLYINCLY